MKRFGYIAIWLAMTTVSLAAGGESKTSHVVVTYDGVEAAYAEAIGQVTEAARDIAIERFGFDMPKTVKINVTLDPKRPVRLFTDGYDGMVLNVMSADHLRKPSESGVYNLYGFCHEIGHVAMYRLIRNRLWMTSAAAEGWAHYLGSEIVDDVYAREGDDLWPDQYDYLADGTARLDKQLAGENLSDMVKAAGLWKEIGEIIGEDKIASVFKAWSKANVDLTDPGVALRQTLAEIDFDPRLTQWWTEAEPVFVCKRPKSGFEVQTAKSGDLLGQPVELAQDDGKQVGKGSFGGNGHAVRFEAPGDGWYLTDVRIYGSRYGAWLAPREDFHIWLCDKDFKVITDFAKPYGLFKRGRQRWVNVSVEPTVVPVEFVICVAFNPTRSKGVYLGYDGSVDGESYIALAGKPGERFDKGDWMIRVKLDQLKTADALRSAD